MFSYENSIRGGVNITKLWGLYSDVNYWHEWDLDIQKVKLEGEFATGTKGTLFINDLPPLPFTLDEVEQNNKFVVKSVIGEISVQFGHFIIDEGNSEYTIKHTVTITGASEEQLKGMGQSIVANISDSMKKLLQLSKEE